MMDSVGTVNLAALGSVRSTLDQLPPVIHEGRRDSIVGRAVVLGLVMDKDPVSLIRQFKAVRKDAARGVVDRIEEVSEAVRSLSPEQRLPALEWVLPSLYTISLEEYDNFEKVLHQCVISDGKIDFGEFILQRIVTLQVPGHLENREINQGRIRFDHLAPLTRSIEILLSFVVQKSVRKVSEQRALFAKAVKGMEGLGYVELKDSNSYSYSHLNQALDQMGEASFSIRKAFLQICIEVVSGDGQITVIEAEWIRALSISLGCPMAPLAVG